MDLGLPAAQRASPVCMIKEGIEICQTAKRKAASTFNASRWGIRIQTEEKVKQRAEHFENLQSYEASLIRMKRAAITALEAGAGNTEVTEKLDTILEEYELSWTMLQGDMEMYEPAKFNAEEEIRGGGNMVKGAWRQARVPVAQLQDMLSKMSRILG